MMAQSRITFPTKFIPTYGPSTPRFNQTTSIKGILTNRPNILLHSSQPIKNNGSFRYFATTSTKAKDAPTNKTNIVSPKGESPKKDTKSVRPKFRAKKDEIDEIDIPLSEMIALAEKGLKERWDERKKAQRNSSRKIRFITYGCCSNID
eukprot:TRINITY_DN2578_c0_g1_i1.p1 TRINITY_DN2578_c0_g1~~TRINITY_DN2578_c0_g1_i1.p1  ORF type:complete len:149 (-),score=30.17 TRINITY_DN2578_c0_g1_i1:154-600(-)